jgi:hypothetical protein
MMDMKVGDTVERVEGEFNGMRVGDNAKVTGRSGCSGLVLHGFEGVHSVWNFKIVSSQEEPTRPTKKTVADAWEGEKWTHTTSLGRCRVLIDTPDEYGYVVVEYDGEGYSLAPPRRLKPIKPTLTKDEMLSRVEKIVRGDLFGELCRSRLIDLFDTFDVTD